MVIKEETKQTVISCSTVFDSGDDDVSNLRVQKAFVAVEQETEFNMKSPRDYYPPEYLAEVVAEEKRRAERQSLIRPRSRSQSDRVSRFTVQRLAGGCLLYQLHSRNIISTR